MATLTKTIAIAGPLGFHTRLRRCRLGLAVGLTAVMMVFVSLTSAYLVRQGLPTLDSGTNTLIRDWFAVPLPRLLFINTLLLMFSSVTMELARRQTSRRAALAGDSSDASVGHEQGISWLALTVVMGLAFLAGQWEVWRELAADGFYVSTNPSSSFLYLLTGMHGLHLLGGVLALMAAGGAAVLRRPTESRAIMTDVAGWYWHCMALLWIYILGLLEFVR